MLSICINTYCTGNTRFRVEIKHDHSFFWLVSATKNKPLPGLHCNLIWISLSATVAGQHNEFWRWQNKKHMFIHELKWHRVLRGNGFFKYISNVTGAFGCWHHLNPTDGEAHKTDDALAASHVTEYIQEGKKCHQEQELFLFFLFFFF